MKSAPSKRTKRYDTAVDLTATVGSVTLPVTVPNVACANEAGEKRRRRQKAFINRIEPS